MEQGPKINFIEFIDHIKKMYDHEEAKISFNSGGIRFGISTKFNDWLVQKGINQDDVETEIKYKSRIFSSTIFNILNDKEPKEKIDKKLVSEDYEKIVDYIKKTFIDKKLKNKFLFEKTVKNHMISDIQWEVLNKKFDSNIEKKVSNLNTVVLKLILEDKSNTTYNETREKSIVIELNTDAIDELIEQLKKMKLNLEND